MADGVELITQAEYARRRGVAKSAVARAVSENRITLIDGRIDPAVADIQWERNTRLRGDSGRSTTLPPPEVEPPPASSDEYSANRARRERYEADMAELRLREQQGDLVRVVEVRAEIAKAIGQLRMNALQLPARLAPLVAPETDQAKVYALLDSAIRELLSNASASM